MAKRQYTLYLDESETSNSCNGNPHFCMAGAIIRDDDYPFIEGKLIDFKRRIFSTFPNPEGIVLHQMNIINAEKGRLDKTKFPEYNQFRANKIRANFYTEFTKIFDYNKIIIVGGSINKNTMAKGFDIKKPQKQPLPEGYRNKTDAYLVALQLLLENYCHFLCMHNGIGQIIYETRNLVPDEKLRDRFYHIKLMGSMYITKEAMADHLLGMDFVDKKDNNAGLQIADFIPNAFARNHAGFGTVGSNDAFFRKLAYYRYNGINMRDQARFGVKYMP